MKAVSDSTTMTQLSISEQIRIQEATLERLLGWLAAADGRVGLVLALDTAMLGVLAALAPGVSDWRIAPAILASIAGLLLITSIVFLSLASFPRVDGPRGSVIFFQGIAARNVDQYRAAISQLSDDDYLTDLGNQCHRNAEIACQKFRWIRWSMGSLYVGVLPWVLAVFLLYQLRG